MRPVPNQLVPPSGFARLTSCEVGVVEQDGVEGAICERQQLHPVDPAVEPSRAATAVSRTTHWEEGATLGERDSQGARHAPPP